MIYGLLFAFIVFVVVYYLTNKILDRFPATTPIFFGASILLFIWIIIMIKRGI